jgi:1-phosphofructokinase
MDKVPPRRPKEAALLRVGHAFASRFFPDADAQLDSHRRSVACEPAPPRITVFAPDTLLSMTIEPRPDGHGAATEEVHIHAAGQGVWAARMAGEMGASPVLCSLLGGETGIVLRPLLDAMPGERRLVHTDGASGSYVTDRREGRRRLIAAAVRPPPRRHEVDDLVAVTMASALSSKLLVVCNPYPPAGFPEEAYETIVADAKASGVTVLVDLSSPRLERVLPHRPDLVKLNDWELAEYVQGPVDGLGALSATERLRDAGARNVAVTRGAGPILVLAAEDEPYEIRPPTLPRGYREGCGDTMMGAVAAAWARGLPLRAALVIGAAAGSVNFLRHGLGTGKRATVEEFAGRITVRPVLRTAA